MASAPTVRALTGFKDTLPADAARWQHVEAAARSVAGAFGYHEIRTPVLESADVYHRGVGETSDVVQKETYTFTDRDGSQVTLRPEGTAGVVRAVIEAGLLNLEGARVKVFYIASNFRHERPQKGRLRQHHQFGIEAFGVPTPEQDVECILLQLAFYQRCGVRDLSLSVNSLGDRESKQRYRDALVKFLTPKQAELSEDSQRRLTTNPLRILDSKDPRDVAAREGVPAAADSLSDKSKAHFARVVELLTTAGVAFKVDASLVRGFDYYTDTLWEVTAGGLGSQAAIGGGGRYDNLVEQLGGRPTPGVGFGSGLERLLLALEGQNVELPVKRRPLVWLAHHGDAGREFNLTLANHLRQADIATDLDLTGRSIKAQMKMADREKARWCVVVGDDELAAGNVVLKDLNAHEQQTVPQDKLLPMLADLVGRSTM
ncbi:MAG TPA: histidine--tRNA ligase [Tepidisphaeraceae bacterium]|jgi:histidyl-tRNA synthetase